MGKLKGGVHGTVRNLANDRSVPHREVSYFLCVEIQRALSLP
jgi:hypothetical protein